MEAEFFHNSSETMKKLYDYKFIKPLETRKAEADRKRKELKGQWERALRAANEAGAELRKAREALGSRDAAYQKAKEAVAEELCLGPASDARKVDKGRARESDLLRKKAAADADVLRLQRDVADKLAKLEAKKAHILSELRELIYQCDQTTKACTVAYFQALSGAPSRPPLLLLLPWTASLWCRAVEPAADAVPVAERRRPRLHSGHGVHAVRPEPPLQLPQSQPRGARRPPRPALVRGLPLPPFDCTLHAHVSAIRG